MFAFTKYLLPCIALVVAVASSPAAAITNSVTFNFEDILQRAYVNRSVTVESVSTPRTNSPNIAVNYYLSTNTGTSGSFVLSNMLDGTYRVSVLGNPRPTTFLIGVPTNNPGTHYASDLLTTNIDANAATAWTRSQADSRYVRANTTNGVLVSPTNFFWANITNGANVAIARGAGGKITISATNSGGGATTDGASLTNFPGAPANATEAALRGITNTIHIINIPGAADGIGTALSPRNATNSTVFDNILSNAPNGTVIKLGPQLFWTKGAVATGRARYWGLQNEFGIEGQNGTILRLDPTNNTSASSIVAIYLGTAGSGATSNYFVRNIAVELNPYNFPTNIALQGIQLYGDGLEITGSKLSGMRGRFQNGGAEAFGIVADDAGSSTATLPRIISRNFVGNSDSNTIDTTSAIYGVRASVINNTVDDTNTYAITLGSGSSYAGNRVLNSRCAFWADTAPVSNAVAVANYAKASQGTLTLYPSSGVFNGITFSDNILHGTVHVVFLVGNGGTISNVTLANNRLIGDAGNSSVLNLQAVHNSSFINNTMSTGLVSVVGATNTVFQNNRFFDGTAATTNSYYGGLFVNGGLDADYIQNTRLTNIASIDLTTGGYLHMNVGPNGAEFRSATSLRPSVLFDSFSGNDIALRTEFIFATNSSAGIMIQRPANTNQLEVKLGDNSAFGDLWVANLYTNGVQVTGGSSGSGGGNVSATNNPTAIGQLAISASATVPMISFTNAISNITIQLAGMSSNQVVVTGQDGQFTNLVLNADQFVTNVGTASGSPSLAIKSGAALTNTFTALANITNLAASTNALIVDVAPGATNILIKVGGTNRFYIGMSGATYGMFPANDNLANLGLNTSANRWASGYFADTVYAGSVFQVGTAQLRNNGAYPYPTDNTLAGTGFELRYTGGSPPSPAHGSTNRSRIISTNIGGITYPVMVDGNTNVTTFAGFTNTSSTPGLVIYTNAGAATAVRNYAVLVPTLGPIYTNITLASDQFWTNRIGKTVWANARVTVSTDGTDTGAISAIVDPLGGTAETHQVGIFSTTASAAPAGNEGTITIVVPPGASFKLKDISGGAGGSVTINSVLATAP